ncbi:helix-turn-helix domain-containing protein [Alkalihalobacillus oceani]|uniref:Helix-turn-helix domain-containing protein n=1 Tax=Halalkalibacter oceani TaxID=1653776 RepID=A0A9X2DNY1_9BACI|nr:helix-turn-helix domain-containing protein [Halalkalibacter oceani]MCM3713642.1 helix-turn-helix domain-containing protein [Halalkalibacter oceani]
MNAQQAFICIIISAYEADRSIYGVYHIVKGKKSSQTIQDAALFSLLPYFGLLPALTRAELEQAVRELHQLKWLEKVGEDRFVLTGQGQAALDAFLQLHPVMKELNGWEYHTLTETAWLRLRLYIQSLTHLVARTPSFYPLTHEPDIQRWVKNMLPPSDKRETVHRELYAELVSFLKTCRQEQAFVFVHQLSGEKRAGMTKQQLASALGWHPSTVHLYHMATLHQMFNTTAKQPERYRRLAMFAADLKQEVVLTASTKQTMELLAEGYSLEEISRIRKLKQNTIEDHIVEIAWHHSAFSIRPFVRQEWEQQIIEVAEQLGTSRLRELKDRLPQEVSYFMIRLVMAKRKVSHGA